MLKGSTGRLLNLAAESAVRATNSPADALGAITMSITAIDHFLHYVPELIKMVHIHEKGERSLRDRTDGFMILQELNDNRSSIRTRISALCFLLSGYYPAWGDEIFQHLSFSIDIRNEIIHLPSRIIDPSKPPAVSHPKWIGRILEKKVLTSEDVKWLTSDQVAERPEIARWVVLSVWAFFNHIGGFSDENHFITGSFHPNSPLRHFSRIREKLV